jgi:hypothetical protein
MPTPCQNAKNMEGYTKQKIVALGVTYVVRWDKLKKMFEAPKLELLKIS